MNSIIVFQWILVSV